MIFYQVISGFGMRFTCKSNNKPYPLIGLDEIRRLVDNPQCVAKEKARWALPSTLHSRVHSEQREHGSYLYLWADLDKISQGIEYVRDVIESIIDADYEIYTTRSATLENQKTRVLIPLANAVSPLEWHQYQVALNKLICEHQIVPDEANKQYAQFFYLPNQGDFYAHYSRRDENYFNPALEWHEHLNIKLTERTELTEIADDDRRVQMNTEITDVIVCDEIDYLNLPTACTPEEEGERNKKLFTFARYLKKDYPQANLETLRPIVLGWHNHFKSVIGTQSFSETWTDFRRGWKKIKIPYGEGFESIINCVDFDEAVPDEFLKLGYTSSKEFKLLLICRQLQLIDLDNPFYLSCRKAGELIQYNHQGASRMLDSFVADQILEKVEPSTMHRAVRYKYIWKDF